MNQNHHAANFDMDFDYGVSSSTAPGNIEQPTMMEDIKELIWQNGQPITQSQTQRPSSRKSPSRFDQIGHAHTVSPNVHHQHQQQQQSLYMQDDELLVHCPWSQYTLTTTNFDGNDDFCDDFLYHLAPTSDTITAPAVSISAAAFTPADQAIDNLHHFPRLIPSSKAPLPQGPVLASLPELPRQRGRVEMPLDGGKTSIMGESTVVDSNATPVFRASEAAKSATAGVSSGYYGYGTISGATATAATDTAAATNSNTTANPETATCDITTTSSTGGSSASAQLPQVSSGSPNRDTAAVENRPPSPFHDRKRKKTSRADDSQCVHDGKKPARCSMSSKRARAAEVHNLSERRRRDRINEKMRALQELIPRCNKSDKASMLDEAIEYLKTLQLQVQMMSMGCGMVPMMFPGMQQYMGMGLGMEMGINRPVMPFANVLAGASLSSPATAAANLNPRFTLPAFPLPPMGAPEPSQNPNVVRMQNFADPYQQYLAVHQLQLQNQGRFQGSKPSSSRAVDSHDKNQADQSGISRY